MIYKLYYDENEVNISGNDSKNGPNFIPERLKIVVLGDYMVGKTSFIKRLCQQRGRGGGDTFDESHEKTKSVHRRELDLLLRNGKRVTVELIDTPGIQQHNLDINSVFPECHGAIVMYDVTSPYSFLNVPQYLEKLKRRLSPNGEILLVGSKTDLTKERKVTFKEADEFAANLTLSLFEISAKSNINVDNALAELVQHISDRYQIGTFDASTMVITTDDKPRPSTALSLFCCWVY